MRASEIMTFGTATVRADAPVSEAIRIMIDHRISALPVLDQSGRVRGIISESDFFRPDDEEPDIAALLVLSPDQRLQALEPRRVSEIMTLGGTTVDAQAPLKDVVAAMQKGNLRHLPVVDDGHAVGMISRIDVLRLLVDAPGIHHPH